MNKDNNISQELKLKATIIFSRNWEAFNSDKRFIVNEGGSRSSKTWSICQCVILYCLSNPNKLVSIMRKTGPALKVTVYRDFFEIIKGMGIYDENSHHKGEGQYVFDNGSVVEFFSIDMPQKVRGRKRDIGWCNEANELSYDDFQQVALRTIDKIIVDYNPSSVDSFLYYFPEEKTVNIHSTYKDNPFLQQTIIDQIESYQFTDLDYYNIFCLGLRCYSVENVFPQWEVTSRDESFTDFVYGLDHGWSHPNALVKVYYNPLHKNLHVEELICESHMTTGDLVDRMSFLEIDKSKMIVTETARPEITADLKRAGYKLINADKKVRDGILAVKGFRVTVEPGSDNIVKENMNYRYKKVNGKIQEDVVKLFDDCMDAIRYATMFIKKNKLKESNPKSNVYSFDF